MAPSVLVIGASGILGRPLMQEFIRQKARFSRVAVLATEPSKKAKFAEEEAAGVEVVVGGLLDPSSYRGFGYVISLLGNPVLRLQPAIIDIAYSAGVRHFYPSEFGSDIGQDSAFLERYYRSKQDTRLHCITAAKAHPDFKYTLFMTGSFYEMIEYIYDPKTNVCQLYGNPDSRIDLTGMPDVCRYTVDSIFLPQDKQKREIKVAAARTTIRAAFEAFSKVRGIDVKIETLDPAIAAHKRLESFRAGDEAGEYAWALKVWNASGGAILTGELDNHLFGFEPVGLADGLKPGIKIAYNS